MKLITCNKFHPQDAASVFAFSEEGDILFLMWILIHQSVQIVTLFTYSLVYLQGYKSVIAAIVRDLGIGQ